MPSSHETLEGPDHFRGLSLHAPHLFHCYRSNSFEGAFDPVSRVLIFVRNFVPRTGRPSLRSSLQAATTLRSRRATRHPNFRFALFVACAGSDALSFRLETLEPTSAIHLLFFQRRATRGLRFVSAEAFTNPAPIQSAFRRTSTDPACREGRLLSEPNNLFPA
jgi:hypothetical protein